MNNPMRVQDSTKLICITNRHLCHEDFFVRLERICALNPKAIILREKDLSELEYEKLATQVQKICKRYQVTLVLHSFYLVAIRLGVKHIHLPLAVLTQLKKEQLEEFTMIGTSCHSLEDVKYANEKGCTYIIAGHIFETDCKKGLNPRGISFLKEVCVEAQMPVYAIGGINKDNTQLVINAGAEGYCMMSQMMAGEIVCAEEE